VSREESEEFDVVDCCDRCLAERGSVEVCSEECGVDCRDLYDVDEEFWGEFEEGEEEEEWWWA